MKKIAPLILLLPIISIVALSLGATEVSELFRYIFNPFLSYQYDPQFGVVLKVMHDYYQ